MGRISECGYINNHVHTVIPTIITFNPIKTKKKKYNEEDDIKLLNRTNACRGTPTLCIFRSFTKTEWKIYFKKILKTHTSRVITAEYLLIME